MSSGKAPRLPAWAHSSVNGGSQRLPRRPVVRTHPRSGSISMHQSHVVLFLEEDNLLWEAFCLPPALSYGMRHRVLCVPLAPCLGSQVTPLCISLLLDFSPWCLSAVGLLPVCARNRELRQSGDSSVLGASALFVLSIGRLCEQITFVPWGESGWHCPAWLLRTESCLPHHLPAAPPNLCVPVLPLSAGLDLQRGLLKR